MSLYYEAASILTEAGGGSLKSRIYNDAAKLKSRPAQLFALITETAKYDGFLKEVIDNADILKLEPKLTPLLSILLVHDYLFSSGNIAASKDHPLKLAILRHKARLSSEFTKARLRRKCATIPQLKLLLAGDSRTSTLPHPRWVRVNRLQFEHERLFPQIPNQPEFSKLCNASTTEETHHRDEHIPDLLAFPPGKDLIALPEYKTGKIILQDKASCFPAYLLLGDENETVGDVMDACAAPGNKTTHLAAILCSRQRKKLRTQQHQIFACERDPRRSEVLQRMVAIAGADKMVAVLPRQDFFALDLNEERFANVTHLLLDPTCSGSGIVGREDIPKLKLPEPPQGKRKNNIEEENKGGRGLNNKKRKRDVVEDASESRDDDEQEETRREVDQARLEKLSNLQTRIIERAMSFPAARRITYSTCSTHVTENEMVVVRALRSAVAREHGWRVLKREEQVKGLRVWQHRGAEMAPDEGGTEYSDVVMQACIRCYPGTEDGTMGFFVCCLVRDGSVRGVSDGNVSSDEFEGFED